MIPAVTKKRVSTGVLTGNQSVSYLVSQDLLAKKLDVTSTYKIYRALRKDPTIALGRGLLISGIGSGAWSVEHDEDVAPEAIETIEDLVLLRDAIMTDAVAYGRIDYGWMAWEKIFAKGADDKIVLRSLKPLLHDITSILIDKHGNFKGYRQNPMTGMPLDIPLEKCLHIAFEVEGNYLYGYPLLENCRAAQDAWTECNAGAKRYDEKIAGSHFVVHYPPGTSTVDGETLENSEVASQLLAALESSGSMSMPSTTADYVQELNDQQVSKLFQWDVTLLSDKGPRQATFRDRLKYLDILKIRGLVLPERAMLEGSYGNKAEASVHVGLAITHMTEIDQHVTRMINSQLVDQLLVLNHGEDAAGTVRLIAAPLVDLKTEFLRELYLALIPTDGSSIDVVSLKEQLNIPFTKKEVTTDEA